MSLVAITKTKLAQVLSGLPLVRGLDQVKEDLEQSEMDQFDVRRVDSTKLFDIWERRARRGRSRGDDIDDIELLLTGLKAVIPADVGMVHFEAGDHLVAVFLRLDSGDAISMLRRTDRRVSPMTDLEG